MASESEIHRALRQIQSIKKLVRKRCGILMQGNINENVYRIPGIIFSDKTYNDSRLLIKYIVEYYEKEKVPPIEQFDLIVVNNNMIVLNCRPNAYISNGKKQEIIFKEYGEETFMMFLMLMNKMPRSEMGVGPNVLSFYLDESKKANFKEYPDLSERLRKAESTVGE